MGQAELFRRWGSTANVKRKATAKAPGGHTVTLAQLYSKFKPAWTAVNGV